VFIEARGKKNRSQSASHNRERKNLVWGMLKKRAPWPYEPNEEKKSPVPLMENLGEAKPRNLTNKPATEPHDMDAVPQRANQSE